MICYAFSDSSEFMSISDKKQINIKKVLPIMVDGMDVAKINNKATWIFLFEYFNRIVNGIKNNSNPGQPSQYHISTIKECG